MCDIEESDISLDRLSCCPRLANAADGFRCISSGAELGVARVTSSGEIDRAAARRLAEALFDAAEHAVLVILDLSRVTLLDSNGLRAILTADAWLRRADCRLALVPGPPSVHRVFELAGTDGVLEFVAGQIAGDPEPRETTGSES